MSKKLDFSHLPATISGRTLSSRATIEIDHYLVRVTEKGRFGAARGKWNAPLSDFRGVLRWSETVLHGGGENTEWVTWHRLTLVHPDEKKSLLLYTSQVEADTRKLWKDAACALHLPAMYETGDGIVSRAPEDLEESVRDLAAEKKISVDFDAHAPPPTGIVLEAARGHQRGRHGSHPGFYQRVTLGSGLIKRCIVITPSEVCHYWKTPFGTFFHKAIQLTKLKSVDRYDSSPPAFVGNIFWGGATWGHGAIVEMESISYDVALREIRATISVGGLSDEQSHWLKKFILAATIDVSR